MRTRPVGVLVMLVLWWQVSVVAFSADEARATLGVNLARHDIQPVWLQVQNRESIGFVLPPMVIDYEYFSPMEATWQAHGWLTGATNTRIDAHFRTLRRSGLCLPRRTSRSSSTAERSKCAWWLCRTISSRANHVCSSKRP